MVILASVSASSSAALYPRNWPFAVLPLGPLALHHSGRRCRGAERDGESAQHMCVCPSVGPTERAARRGGGTGEWGVHRRGERGSRGGRAAGAAGRSRWLARSLAQSPSSPASNAVHEHVKLSNLSSLLVQMVRGLMKDMILHNNGPNTPDLNLQLGTSHCL